MLTSVVSEVVEAGGEKGVSCNLVHSKPSLSFNKQRRSWVERFRATSMDTMAVVSKSVTENMTQDWRKYLPLVPAGRRTLREGYGFLATWCILG
jgi:hypothetical protein